MISASIPMDRMLRACPQLRGYFRGRPQIPEAELLAFVQVAVPEVRAAAWPAVRLGLLRSQLLHEVAPGLLSFEASPMAGSAKPVLPPELLALGQQLQTGLALPLGCLWSTRWLRPFLPSLPPLLVVEVNWAERGCAERLTTAAALPDPVVVGAWQRFSPVSRVQGIPTARLEKMLVDAAQRPELAMATSDAALAAALALLQARQSLQLPRLLQYAARCGAELRWAAVLHLSTNLK